ncbi:MAG TPA: hypothetical protein ENH72_09615 [Pseudomonas sabulinigri]|uniref:Regulatory protein RecX n=1 Tax=marine sediment metagenome TaxID=412755 RepID=A0A0F9VVM3_9ZZZZ|nr:hypothetical protein [Halopseudomonas sabulinigri]HEC51749.1 hypothetical protein [Halopseudomonas sabulinigri]
MPDQILFKPGNPDDKPVKQQLLEAEARSWIRRGYRTTERLEALKALLREKKRPESNISTLVEEMRRQWLRRGEWLS